MTVLELNQLPYITANIERILRYLEADSTEPDWFIETGNADPLRKTLELELPRLMAEYRRLMAYINGITVSRIKRIFVMRFIEKKPFREIGLVYGLVGNTVKKQIYDYVRLNPEGYCSCKELAERLDLDTETVRQWCRKGLLPGVKKQGRRRWLIPQNVDRPQDRRRKDD